MCSKYINEVIGQTRVGDGWISLSRHGFRVPVSGFECHCSRTAGTSQHRMRKLIRTAGMAKGDLLTSCLLL
jgi:hypothetical protein